MPPTDLAAEISALYGLPLGEFTTARNALAGRLRKAGERAAAEEVQGLAKPTPSAWAVNRLLRGEREAMAALLEAGERARSALGKTMAGAGPEVVREALAEMRRRRAELLKRGAALLADGGRAAAPAQLERLATDLEALALSPAAQEVAERGWLDRDLDPPGFEVLAGLQLASAPARPPSPSAPEPAAPRSDPPRETGPEEARRRERLAKLQAAVDERLRESSKLAAEADQEEAAATAAIQEAERAERFAAAARQGAEAAQRSAGRARERAERAAAELTEAREHLAAAESA
jgi:hypothetical protein